ncbi:MAG: hypothetical protein QXY79_01800, partial [Candidatus Methanomethylicia archaeon]
HIIKKIEEENEKILLLIQRRLPSVDVSKFNIAINNGTLVIRIPAEIYLLEGLQYIKRGIVNDIERFFKNIRKVEIVETYEIKHENREEK